MTVVPIEEAIKQTGLCRTTLYRYVKRGLPKHEVGGKIMFNVDEVLEWKAQCAERERRGRKCF